MDDDQKKREAADEKMIDDAFRHLLDTYLASSHRKKVDIITKAFNFARQAHKGVRRLSGEPYIMHPIAVAQIACEEVGLGSTSICAALLHDVVEDTDYTTEDIENIFGAKIAQIVDGLTKISGGIFGEQASAQAENFKKLLLNMSDDIRVILIKICDRLHNMRTLASQPANKQYKIAGETLYIYAPLANRLGLNKIKIELEDLSFRYEHPDAYAAIEQKLASTQASRHTLFDQFTAPIEQALDEMGIKYVIKERVKSPYSIWNKMQNKHVTFEEIYDILAVRVIFTPHDRANEINECFNIYVAISKIYKSHPDRLRDWLNHPKANGYQALHVTLMSKQGRWIEVQIRSDRMDEIAEQGFAAHWKYKEGEEGATGDSDAELNDWLHTIKEILGIVVLVYHSIDVSGVGTSGHLIAVLVLILCARPIAIVACQLDWFAVETHTELCGNKGIAAKGIGGIECAEKKVACGKPHSAHNAKQPCVARLKGYGSTVVAFSHRHRGIFVGLRAAPRHSEAGIARRPSAIRVWVFPHITV